MQHLTQGNAELSPDAIRYAPRLYFEVKVDFSDVRSGFRVTRSLYQATELDLLEEDTLWTQDMVWSIDPPSIVTGRPRESKSMPMPDFVDRRHIERMEIRYLSYLLRYYEVSLFRNSQLKVYSNLGETRGDFERRCADLLGDQFRGDLDILQEQFVRRIDGVREKFQRELVTRLGGGDFEVEKSDSHWKSKMHDLCERITNLFLETTLNLSPVPEAPVAFEPYGDALQRLLLTLEAEAQAEILKLVLRYQEHARSIDEYIIHPNLKDIHLVRSGILWTPLEAHP